MTSDSTSPQVSLLRTWWRRLYWLRRDRSRLRLLDRRGPNIFAGFGGIGDELIATCTLHELRRRLGRPLNVLARHPELFRHNPDVAQIGPADPTLIETAQTWSLDLRRPNEWQGDNGSDRQTPPAQHIIADAVRAGGVRGAVTLRPYLHLATDELAAAHSDVPQIVIMSSGSSAMFHFRNKDWGSANFQEVVTRLRSRYRIVQLGAATDPLLDGAIDRRGATSLRASAAILAQSRFFIGQVGLLMHLARAVECRSVIVFGGRELPEQSGYPCNENLSSHPPCSPCWQKNLCDFQRVCLTEIRPEHVLAAVSRVEARLTQPLETTVVET